MHLGVRRTRSCAALNSMRTYADVCWRMLTCDIHDGQGAALLCIACGLMLTYADACWRVTYMTDKELCCTPNIYVYINIYTYISCVCTYKYIWRCAGCARGAIFRVCVCTYVFIYRIYIYIYDYDIYLYIRYIYIPYILLIYNIYIVSQYR